MKYFLHDSNSFNDEKITELFINFGYEGLGLFYTFLEKIASQEKPIKTSVLKSQLKVGKKLEKCWNFMESLGIIQSNNGDSFNEQLLNFSEKYQIKKEKTREKISQWRDKQKDKKIVTSYEPVSNLPKVKLSKVKLSKVNKEAEVYEWIDVSYLLSFNKWMCYKESRKESYKSEVSEKAFYNKLLNLSKNNPVTADLIIEQSMANNWAGIFDLNQKTQKPEKSPMNLLKSYEIVKQNIANEHANDNQ